MPSDTVRPSAARAAEVVQIRCGSAGSWLVQPESADRPISAHADAHAAKTAARRYCRERGHTRIVLYDRYLRRHVLEPGPGSGSHVSPSRPPRC